MIRKRTHRPLAFLTASMVTLLPACYDWHVTEVAPAQHIRETSPSLVRLTLRDSSQIDIEHPEVVGNAIVGGRGSEGRGRFQADARVARQLDEVVALETRQLNAGGTGIVVVALVVGLVALFATLGDAGGCNPAGC